jgi:uncharacterized LabA/DUF88 family protein
MDTFLGMKKGKAEGMGRSNPFKSCGFYMLILLQSAVFRVISRFNFRDTINKLGKLSKKHGPYFFAYAGCIEFLEDAVFPAVLHSVGKLQITPTVLAFHCEPIVYPVCFAINIQRTKKARTRKLFLAWNFSSVLALIIGKEGKTMERGFRHDQKVAVLVDSSNIYKLAEKKGKRVNYECLLEHINDRQIIRAIAYQAKSDDKKEAGFFKAIENLSFEVKTKPLKTLYNGKKRGNMDVEITIDAVCLADKVDVVVIVSADGDYVPLVNYLRSRGVKVEAMAFKSNISRDLLEAVDDFIPIKDEMLMSARPKFFD